MKTVFAIAQKNLLDIFRDLKGWSIIFLLPIAFIGIFSFVFNRSNDDISFKVGYIDSTSIVQKPYISELEKLKNSKQKLYFTTTQVANLQTGKSKMESKDLDLVLEFTPDTKVKLYIDTFLPKNNAAISILTQFSNSFFNNTESKLQIISTVVNAEQTTVFVYLVPGLIVYGILNLLPQVIYQVSNEVRKKYTFRYFTAKVKSWQIILGHVLSQTVVGLLQTLLLFASVFAFGYSAPISALGLALLIAIPTNLLTVGLGLVIASSFKNANLAVNIGTLTSVILGFLSGAFLTFPEVKLFGNVTLTNLIPSAYATDAFRKVLQYNQGLSSIYTELLVVTGSSIFLILLGSWAYNNFQLKNMVE